MAPPDVPSIVARRSRAGCSGDEVHGGGRGLDPMKSMFCVDFRNARERRETLPVRLLGVRASFDGSCAAGDMLCG